MPSSLRVPKVMAPRGRPDPARAKRQPPTPRIRCLVSAGLVLLTLIAYSPVYSAGFTNLDDRDYVTSNPHVGSGLSTANLRWAFTTFHAANWHPLTWASLQADAQVFGLRPGGFHLTNVLLHCLAAVLLLWAWFRMTGDFWPSAFVAALFAVHPLHVESVAWITERKDVLSGVFWMAALLAYAHYARKPASASYGVVGLFFVLGLLAKPMVVSLPFVFLLLDYWPLGRLGRGTLARRVAEKLPLFGLAAASCGVTVMAQSLGGTVRGIQELPLTARLGHAALAYAGYLRRAIWPAGLALFYPYTQLGWLDARVVGAVLLICAVTIAAIREGRRRPYLAVGWLWFMGTLVPVAGIIQVGAQAMADRYTYLPLIGLSVMLAWGMAELMRRRAVVCIGATTAAALMAGSAACTAVQATYWQDNILLWKHAVDVTPPNARAHASLASALADRGQLEAAARHYEQALAINPRYGALHQMLGALWLELGRSADARRQLDAAVQWNPRDAQTRYDLALCLIREGEWERAREQLRQAISLAPELAEAHHQLGFVAAWQGDAAQAVHHYDEALRLAPRLAPALNDRAVSLGRLGRWAEAVDSSRQAVQVEPRQVRFLCILADGLKQQGRVAEAQEAYGRAARLDPHWPDTAARMAWALATGPDARLRNGPAAVELARQACASADGPRPEFLDVLAAAYAEAGQYAEAVPIATQAERALAAEHRGPAVAAVQARLAAYRQGKPFHQEAPGAR